MDIILDIKVLGQGCRNCLLLKNLCKVVSAENKWPATIEKLTDINEYGDHGVMMVPGLVVNGKVLSQGKIPVKGTLKS